MHSCKQAHPASFHCTANLCSNFAVAAARPPQLTRAHWVTLSWRCYSRTCACVKSGSNCTVSLGPSLSGCACSCHSEHLH